MRGEARTGTAQFYFREVIPVRYLGEQGREAPLLLAADADADADAERRPRKRREAGAPETRAAEGGARGGGGGGARARVGSQHCCGVAMAAMGGRRRTSGFGRR